MSIFNAIKDALAGACKIQQDILDSGIDKDVDIDAQLSSDSESEENTDATAMEEELNEPENILLNGINSKLADFWEEMRNVDLEKLIRLCDESIESLKEYTELVVRDLTEVLRWLDSRKKDLHGGSLAESQREFLERSLTEQIAEILKKRGRFVAQLSLDDVVAEVNEVVNSARKIAQNKENNAFCRTLDQFIGSVEKAYMVVNFLTFNFIFNNSF